MRLEDVTIRSRSELLEFSGPVIDDLGKYLDRMSHEIREGFQDGLEELYHEVNAARSMLMGCVDVHGVRDEMFQKCYLRAKMLRDAIRFGYRFGAS